MQCGLAVLLQEEFDRLVASECIFCGDLMIRYISSSPFTKIVEFHSINVLRFRNIDRDFSDHVSFERDDVSDWL